MNARAGAMPTRVKVHWRLATQEDAAILFAWRNDPVTQAMSVQTEPVSWETHVAWLTKTLANPTRHLWVAVADGQPVGTLRTDDGREGLEVSLTIAPTVRHQGIGTALLHELLQQESRPLVAYIKTKNLVAQQLFAQCQFHRTGRQGELQRWERLG